MTITVLPARNEYTASAGQTVFNYTFKIFANTDLNAYITPAGQDADDLTDLTTSYTVDPATIGDESGGFITLDSGASAGDLVTVVSNVPESRTTDYQFNGDFIPDTVNDDFDRVVQLTKQTEDRAGRTLSFQESLQNATALTLPNPSALQFLRWRSDEAGLVNVDLTSFGTPTDSSVITYNPPFTGGQARTQEDKNIEVFSVKDFGAEGKGLTDDSPAILAAISAAVTRFNAKIYFPAGIYSMDSRAATGLVTSRNIAIIGDGVDVTTIRCASTNTDGALKFEFSDREAVITVKDISIETQASGGGAALEIILPTGGNRHNRSAYLTDVEIRGQDPAADYFDNGIILTGCWRPMLFSVLVGGPFGPGISDDFSDSSLLYAMSNGINFDECYHPEMLECYVWSADHGVRNDSIASPGPEGMRITNCNIVGVKNGVRWIRPDREPTLWLSGNHINYRDIGLQIVGVKLATITDNVIFNEDLLQEGAIAPIDIFLFDAEKITVSSNNFHFDGNPDRKNIVLDSSVLCQDINISSNFFNSAAARGVVIEAGATDISVIHNQFTATYTQQVQDDTGDAIVINSAKANRKLVIDSSNSDALAGPFLQLYRNKTTPAAGVLGEVEYAANNSAGSKTIFSAIRSNTGDITAGSERGQIDIFTSLSGVLENRLSVQDANGANQTAMLLERNNGVDRSLQRVTIGAVDSGGVGFRVLRVPN